MGTEVCSIHNEMNLLLPFSSPHPYLFFNKDGTSITFIGFNVNQGGDLIDPVHNRIIERAAMTPQLYAGLRHNQVNLSENYQHWSKNIMIKKIATVMGLEWEVDPDPTYVLTVDNVIKILAIQMRFRYRHCRQYHYSYKCVYSCRCNIPVVIMGETGCGKTRLIRFMCDLAAQGCKYSDQNIRNMLIMKVYYLYKSYSDLQSI